MRLLAFILLNLVLSPVLIAQNEKIDRQTYGSALRSSYAKMQAEDRQRVRNAFQEEFGEPVEAKR